MSTGAISPTQAELTRGKRSTHGTRKKRARMSYQIIRGLEDWPDQNSDSVFSVLPRRHHPAAARIIRKGEGDQEGQPQKAPGGDDPSQALAVPQVHEKQRHE